MQLLLLFSCCHACASITCAAHHWLECKLLLLQGQQCHNHCNCALTLCNLAITSIFICKSPSLIISYIFCVFVLQSLDIAAQYHRPDMTVSRKDCSSIQLVCFLPHWELRMTPYCSITKFVRVAYLAQLRVCMWFTQ